MKNYIYLIMIILCSTRVTASQKSLYSFSWLDQDKEVYVLQNRYYRKNNSFMAALTGGVTTSGAFLNAYNAQVKLSYYFSENWGLQGMYSLNTGEQNSSSTSIRNQGVIPFFRIMKNYIGVNLLWSPFYAKINIFNSIIYFDWIFGIGYAQVTDENNILEFSTQTSNPELTQEKNNGALLCSNLLFYLSKDWGLKLDLTIVNYFTTKVDDSTTKILNNHYDLNFGVNYIF
jgi:outer membrane beta-barrel protein